MPPEYGGAPPLPSGRPASAALPRRSHGVPGSMPEPDPSRIFSEVYAEESPVVAAQRDEQLRYLDGFAEPAQGGAH